MKVYPVPTPARPLVVNVRNLRVAAVQMSGTNKFMQILVHEKSGDTYKRVGSFTMIEGKPKYVATRLYRITPSGDEEVFHIDERCPIAVRN